jgi:hypothetical protein
LKPKNWNRPNDFRQFSIASFQFSNEILIQIKIKTPRESGAVVQKEKEKF